MTSGEQDKQGSNAETVRPEGPASEKPKTPSVQPASVKIPEAPKAPADLVIAGVGENLEAAFGDMFSSDEKPQPAPDIDDAPTQIKRSSYTPEISVAELSDEVQEDILLDDNFDRWENGQTANPSSLPPTGEIPQAPAPQPVLPPPIPALLPTANNLPTIPAPAAPLRIPSNPASFDIDLDEDCGPKAGVFRVPHLIPPNFTSVSAVKPATTTSTNDKETVLPPPRLPNSSSIPITVESDDEDRITADFTADAAIIWAFSQSPIFQEYEEASAEYERSVKKNPHLEKPEYATYLARFRATQEKD